MTKKSALNDLKVKSERIVKKTWFDMLPISKVPSNLCNNYLLNAKHFFL